MNASPVPSCPRCNAFMIKRNGKFGEFWGCSTFPTCRGTLDPKNIKNSTPRTEQAQSASPNPTASTGASADWRSNASARLAAQGITSTVPLEPKVEPIPMMSGSPEQEEVWRLALLKQCHIVTEAFAGTGKTWTMIQLCLRLPRHLRIGFLAFGRDIAKEANGKLRASKLYNVICSTYHSFGKRIIESAFPNAQIDEYKVHAIVDEIPTPEGMTPERWISITRLARKMTGHAKNYLVDVNAPGSAELLERIADRHALDIAGGSDQPKTDWDWVLEILPHILEECKKRAPVVFDLDDMIWLPVILGLKPAQPLDILIVDEYQDSNMCQQEFAMLMVGSGRLMVVGDRYQSIFQFRGADSQAMPRIIERLSKTERGVEVPMLTVSRRCPKIATKTAQTIVPAFSCLEEAEMGEEYELSPHDVDKNLRIGDMVLCRINARLIPLAYQLIKRNVRPLIRGRDIGDGLLDLVRKLEKESATIEDMVGALVKYRMTQTAKLIAMGEKAEGRLANLNDRCDCLAELLRQSDSIDQLKDRIDSLFSDKSDGNCVLLSTGHRAKGLEAERVFILAPELIPHPAAGPNEMQGELNLAYVMVTRVKWDKKKGAPGTLVFCGHKPSIFYSDKEQEATR